MFRRILLAALVAACAAMKSDVLLRAEAAASACTAPGGAPHPWDPQLLVLCADARVPLTVVHCPPGTMASNATRGCQPTSASDDGPLPAHRRWRLRREEGSGQATSSSVDPVCEGGAGFRCADCDRRVMCAQVGDQGVVAVFNMSCATLGDMGCDPKTNACDKDIACPTAEVSGFRCLQEGLFPDTEDCKRYHVCDKNLQHFTDTCNTEYDPESSECVDGGAAVCAQETSPPPMKCSQADSAPKTFAKTPSFYRICLPLLAKGYTEGVYRLQRRTDLRFDLSDVCLQM